MICQEFQQLESYNIDRISNTLELQVGNGTKQPRYSPEEATQTMDFLGNDKNLCKYKITNSSPFTPQFPIKKEFLCFILHYVNQHSVTSLHFDKLSFEAEAAEALGILFENIDCPLNNIIFTTCRMPSKVWEIVMNALKNNKTVKEISITACAIGLEGAKQIADIMNHNETCEKINFSFEFETVIEIEGIKQICAALTKNKTLKELMMGFDGINDEGAKIFANTLENDKKLTNLWLVGNTFGNEGLTHLCNSLKTNSTLKKLGITNTHNSRSRERIMKNLLKFNQTLTETDVLGFKNYPRNKRNIQFFESSEKFAGNQTFVGHSLGNFHSDLSIFTVSK